MFDLHDFADAFGFDPEYTYDEYSVQLIESHRKTLEGLFVDKVLKLLGIKRPAKHYPPKSNADLRALHQAIVDAPASDHLKLSLLYYILLDIDASTKNQEHSYIFADKSYLPSKYQIYMKGLWHLDHLDFEASMALQYITHPSLIPTFADDILETLAHHAASHDASLALAYYHTVQPTLTSPRAIESLFTAIARASVTDAFYFSRTQSESTHRRMLEMLATQVLSSPANPSVADRGLELVNLPFNDVEERWFEDFLITGSGRSLKRAKDTVMVRKIATGKLKDAINIDGLTSRPVGGLSWDVMQDAIQQGLK